MWGMVHWSVVCGCEVWYTDQWCVDVRYVRRWMYGTLISVVWMWGMEHWSVLYGCEVWNTDQWCVDVRYGTLISGVWMWGMEHWSVMWSMNTDPYPVFLPLLPFYLHFSFFPSSLFHFFLISSFIFALLSCVLSSFQSLFFILFICQLICIFTF